MISPTRCHYAELLSDYLDATIDEQSAAAFESHLNDCAECLALLRENSVEPEPEAWLRLLRNTQIDPVVSNAQSPHPSPPDHPVSGVRYTCTRQLGSGGSGDVWEAWDELLGRSVALKFLKHSPASLEHTHRLMQEATALARLSHPHIVSIHELQNLGGTPALVMELVPGPSLARYVRGRPCPPAAAVALLEQLCQAIEHAHALGVVHRDLKPSNVLLKPIPGLPAVADDSAPQLGNWCPKVADFGLAHVSDQPSLTLPGQRLGTPGYMAPEQVSADPQNCGSATDIYGLGAILYELLTGRPPFVSSDPALTMAMILKQDPVSPRTLVQSIPKDLETICLKCLRKEPRDRYDTTRALREDCLAFLENRPISARPISRPVQLLKWARRHPAESATLLVSLALIAAVTIGSLRNAQLSASLSAEALEKVRLFEKTQSLERQKQESIHSKFEQLLYTHYQVLQLLENSSGSQPVNQDAIRSAILRSAAEFSAPYSDLLDQKILADQDLTPGEVRLAADYLDLALRAGASVDFDKRLPILSRLVEKLPAASAPPGQILEIKIRLESIHARFAAGQRQHLRSGQCYQRMASLIEQQLLTFSPDDAARVERLYMKVGMLMNATVEYIVAKRSDLSLEAAGLAEETATQLISADPGNQNWPLLLLEVRLRKTELLPQDEAAALASSTLAQFQNNRWDAPHNAEKASQIQARLQARLQPATP